MPLGQGVGTAGDPVPPGSDQNRARLPAPGQGCLKPRPAVVLAAGDVREFPDQGPALGGHETSGARLLGF